MKLEDIVAVSGMPGLFKMAGSRPNGIIIEDIDSGKRKFVPSRKHQFSPLETISIFTLTDTESLIDVLRKMYALRDEVALISAKASNDDLRAYFLKILPDHDQSRVFFRDIKKMVKWYEFLTSRNLLNSTTSAEEEE
ncbi:MAG: DUF5606 domain-containing protein [Saprospiraceae bacterium]|nr:DUF5606 domain-containing protein [Saprospiraceae bacterium]